MAKLKQAKVITITSMKGGVGKTMVTLQLAVILKKIKKKMLIIDLDLYNGDIAFALNLDIKRSIYNLCDDIANNRYKDNISDEYVIQYDDYIDILASPKDPRQASKIDRKYLEVILRSFMNHYDVILIDTNHILSVNNMIAFECSDVILDVFTNDAFDLKSTKNFVSIAKNIKVDNLLLVLNESLNDRKNHFSNQDIENVVKQKIDFVFPKNFYMKGLDKAIIDGKILEACEKVLKDNPKDSLKFSHFVLRLLEDKGEDLENETE